MNKRLEITPPLFTSMDIFCGGGGASFGIHRAGFTSVLGIDFNTKALECYCANNPEVPILHKAVQLVTAEEVFEITGLKQGELDHLHGSPPCKLYSHSNTRAVSNPPEHINENFYQFIRLINELKPKTFTAENVDGMLTGNKIPYFNTIIRKLRELKDYDFQYKVMNSALYGIPQDRKRVLFIGKRKDIAPSLSITFPKPDPEGTRQLTLRKVLPHIDSYIPGQFDVKPKDNSNLFCTITATDSIEVYSRGRWRGLTMDEMKVLMGFPREFKLPAKSRNVNVRILGNAVPPPLMQAVMNEVRNMLAAPGYDEAPSTLYNL